MTDVRREKFHCFGAQLKKTAPAKGFSSNKGDAKYLYLCVCRRTKLRGKGSRRDKVRVTVRRGLSDEVVKDSPQFVNI